MNVRLDTIPFAVASPASDSTASSSRRRTAENDSWAVSGSVEYDFAANEVRVAPYVSYRFAYFSGDDQSGDNDNRFDPLYYNFNDWNEWYIGEILGEWVTGNSNINASIVRLRANPVDSVTLNLFYIYTAPERGAGRSRPVPAVGRSIRASSRSTTRTCPTSSTSSPTGR